MLRVPEESPEKSKFPCFENFKHFTPNEYIGNSIIYNQYSEMTQQEDQLKLLKEYQNLLSKDTTMDVKAKDEAEKFLLEYELECRRSEELDNFIKSAKKELSDTKTYLKDTLRWKPSDKNYKQIENYERKLNNLKVKYGKLRKENENLREQIQIIRRNASGAHRELNALTSNLQSIQTKTKEFQNFSEANHKLASAHRTRIEKLNSSFTSTRMNINDRVSKLEEIFKKESNSVTPSGFKRPRTPYSELAENIRVLKEMHKKWSIKVRDKEKEIDDYREKMFGLEETLEVMRNVINTGSFTVAVKSFIDSCEQEKDLRSNFLRISEKIENIERNVKKTNEMMKKVSEGSQSKEAKKTAILTKIEKEVMKIEKMSKDCLTIKDSQEGQIEKISPNVLKMIKQLESLNLKAESFDIIEDPSLNSTNVIVHLNKLEELIESLLSGLGKKKHLQEPKETKESKAPVSTYDIEDLPIEETTYPMTFEEIRSQAMSLLSQLNP
jgi:chromosome segregation ATPase